MIDCGNNEPDKNEHGAGNTLTVAAASQKTGDLIDRLLKNAPPPVDGMTKHLALSRGKGIRTVLLLNCAADKDGLVPDEAVEAAASVELFHLATLVHDDIMDDADLRRGIPTVHSRFGKKEAVICGDYLLCLAMSTLAPAMQSDNTRDNLMLVPEFARALGRTCLGELKQYKNNRNLELSVLEYLRIIRGKTSALFYVSAYAGAVVGDCSQGEARVIARIGRYLGMIFQIVDDLKDYEFSAEMAQKPVNNDISEGVVTLPLIMAIKKSPILRDMAVEAFTSAEVAKRLNKGVIEANGADYSRQLATRYHQKASRLLGKLNHEAKRRALSGLLEKAIGASSAF